MLKGVANPHILDSLTIERKPVGDGVVRRANAGMLVHRKLWALMGSTKEERAVVSETLQSTSMEGARLRKTLRDIVAETDDEFKPLGIQMNQIYTNSPLVVVEDGDSPPDLTGLNLVKQQ